ncbi:MAG: membrane dipeptidase, partial [Anaerolineales bacterium]|nr:membrane dipeptidase [Anaerolineales bacterium]
IIDGHQDLAWNMITFGRDYSLSTEEIRQAELGTITPTINGDTLLGWPDFQKGRVAIIFASLFASPIRHKQGEWEKLCYTDISQAIAIYSQQIDTYHRLCETHPDKFNLIRTQDELNNIIEHWKNMDQPSHPVGLVISMEGAEAVRTPAELEDWWNRGVRLIGPAWAGTRFCGGTREPGPLTKEGYALLEGMSSWGYILDISHMDELAALQALDEYPHQVIASHSNAASLLNGVDSNRFLSDRLIQGLIERNGIIGIVPFNHFLRWEWSPADGRQAVSLLDVVAQFDYICQMAGDAHHVGIGSDFDGGFGLQSVPAEIDSIADLRKIIPLLEERGYTEDDIAAIMGENWLSLLQQTLPEYL